MTVTPSVTNVLVNAAQGRQYTYTVSNFDFWDASHLLTEGWDWQMIALPGMSPGRGCGIALSPLLKLTVYMREEMG